MVQFHYVKFLFVSFMCVVFMCVRGLNGGWDRHFHHLPLKVGHTFSLFGDNAHDFPLKLFFLSAFYKFSNTRAKKLKGEFWILFESRQVFIPHTNNTFGSTSFTRDRCRHHISIKSGVEAIPSFLSNYFGWHLQADASPIAHNANPLWLSLSWRSVTQVLCRCLLILQHCLPCSSSRENLGFQVCTWAPLVSWNLMQGARRAVSWLR